MPQSECSFYPYGAWINTRLAISIIVTADSDNVPVATFWRLRGNQLQITIIIMLPVPPSKQTASAYIMMHM